jgi:cyclopropane fatty-acyl-phospholipid synthase-like methyltransferase
MNGHAMPQLQSSSLRGVGSCAGCRGATVARDDGVARARRTYARGEHPVAREVELRTLGADFGGNGYATLAEVIEVGGILELGPGRRLLDVGAGQGWPGVFLARRTGCTVVLADLPVEGLVTATRRATREGLGARALAVVAAGQMLPLRPRAFDAVVHTDVLCCLRPKLGLLRATYRALRPGARTAFSVIFPSHGLPPAGARRAIEAGPPHCGLRTSYPSLLRSAGYVEIEERDLTPEYLETAARKLEVAEQFADDLVRMLGRHDYDEMQAERRAAVAAVTGGLLRRSMFVARRPRRGPARRPPASPPTRAGSRRG